VRRVGVGWDGTEHQPLQLVVDLSLDVVLVEETRGWCFEIDVIGLYSIGYQHG
jgi:hypothetical protein